MNKEKPDFLVDWNQIAYFQEFAWGNESITLAAMPQEHPEVSFVAVQETVEELRAIRFPWGKVPEQLQLHRDRRIKVDKSGIFNAETGELLSGKLKCVGAVDGRYYQTEY